VDGFLWFVREVWPIVREAIPGIRFFVTGGNPPDNVREHFGDDIIGLGRVVDLHNDVYQCARVVVAPIRFGAGVKNKTMEAIQSCCPTVATRVGAEGMNLVKGETIDICDDPVEFARSTIALLAERAHWESRRRAIADLLDTWSAESQVTWATVIERALKVASSPYLERDRQASG
jgi:glycosyltransferase involved in cell wall biosynthesis